MYITKKNLATGKSNTIDLPVTQEQIDAWESGELIQNAMPNLNAEQREFLISGLIPGEFDKIFKKKKRKKDPLNALIESEIKFGVNGEHYEFNLIHNLLDFGLDLESALHNWIARTNTITAEDFCGYVVSKDPENLICVTQQQFNLCLNKNK